ncbi:MAG: hypothetical protein ABFD07_08590 [Methanobacterium sp.]
MKTFCRITMALCMFLAVVFFAIGPVAANSDLHVEKTIRTVDTVEETSVENTISEEGSIEETDNAENTFYGTTLTPRQTVPRRGSN